MWLRHGWEDVEVLVGAEVEVVMGVVGWGFE